MSLLTDNFTEAMNDAGLTRAQQELVVAALAKEPAVIGLVHRRSMDSADFASGHRG
jgi:hypothetical protein